LAPWHRIVLGAAGALSVGLAWLLLARVGVAHGHGPFHPVGHAVTWATWVGAVGMWQLMMVAMMLPVVLPWLGLVAVTHADHPGGLVPAVASFAGGYFGAWLLYSLAAGTLQLVLQALNLIDHDLTLRRPLAVGVLVLAGLFQFTPAKRACLTHCRNPLSYLLARWDNAPPHPFRLGLGHGLYCVACCWALMALAFALGLMNLAWMAVITVLAAAEQVLPGGHRLARVAGVALVGWGLWLAT
jgi:predicted metal-binding membrane protein